MKGILIKKSLRAWHGRGDFLITPQAIRTAFIRGDTLVALQPTEAYSPLAELLSCIWRRGWAWLKHLLLNHPTYNRFKTGMFGNHPAKTGW
jgi:hypothetical protein